MEEYKLTKEMFIEKMTDLNRLPHEIENGIDYIEGHIREEDRERVYWYAYNYFYESRSEKQ